MKKYRIRPVRENFMSLWAIERRSLFWWNYIERCNDIETANKIIQHLKSKTVYL
jgi:hypothetical protein